MSQGFTSAAAAPPAILAVQGKVKKPVAVGIDSCKNPNTTTTDNLAS